MLRRGLPPDRILKNSYSQSLKIEKQNMITQTSEKPQNWESILMRVHGGGRIAIFVGNKIASRV
jgi:hypothetical protein